MLRLVVNFRDVMVNILVRKKSGPCLGGDMGECIIVFIFQKAVLVFKEEIESDASSTI